LWDVLLAHWRQHPVLGTGYRTIELLSGVGGFSAHDIFIWVLTELGLVGIFFFAGFLVMVAVVGRLSIFLAGALSVLVIELTESTLYGWGGPAALTFWLVLLAYPALARFKTRGGSPKSLRREQPASARRQRFSRANETRSQ
jgi:hypothetical protein